jgi:hypothetical protein
VGVLSSVKPSVRLGIGEATGVHPSIFWKASPIVLLAVKEGSCGAGESAKGTAEGIPTKYG